MYEGGPARLYGFQSGLDLLQIPGMGQQATFGQRNPLPLRVTAILPQPVELRRPVRRELVRRVPRMSRRTQNPLPSQELLGLAFLLDGLNHQHASALDILKLDEISNPLRIGGGLSFGT